MARPSRHHVSPSCTPGCPLPPVGMVQVTWSSSVSPPLLLPALVCSQSAPSLCWNVPLVPTLRPTSPSQHHRLCDNVLLDALLVKSLRIWISFIIFRPVLLFPANTLGLVPSPEHPAGSPWAITGEELWAEPNQAPRDITKTSHYFK